MFTCVNTSNPPCEDGIPQCKTVPLKALSDQVKIKYSCFCLFKLFIFICGFSTAVICAFLFMRNNGEIHRITLVESDTFLIKSRFHCYLCKSDIDIFASRVEAHLKLRLQHKKMINYEICIQWVKIRSKVPTYCTFNQDL